MLWVRNTENDLVRQFVFLMYSVRIFKELILAIYSLPYSTMPSSIVSFLSTPLQTHVGTDRDRNASVSVNFDLEHLPSYGFGNQVDLSALKAFSRYDPKTSFIHFKSSFWFDISAPLRFHLNFLGFLSLWLWSLSYLSYLVLKTTLAFRFCARSFFAIIRSSPHLSTVIICWVKLH